MTNSVQILTSAFKNLKQYSDFNFIIHCNGAILQDNDLLRCFAEDIVALQNSGINLVIIHDGNNIVNSMFDKFTLKSATNNLRVTDQASAEIVEMILSGHVNKKIVTKINEASGYATGISGKDCQFIIANRAKVVRYDHDMKDTILNFGFIGELSLINPDILFLLEDNGIIPVISPIALGEDGKTYKIESSELAAVISSVLNAKKLIFISDYIGLTDKNNEIISELESIKISEFIDNDSHHELSSYLNSSLMALENNVETIHIINGKTPHTLLKELFTDEIVGTSIKL